MWRHASPASVTYAVYQHGWHDVLVSESSKSCGWQVSGSFTELRTCLYSDLLDLSRCRGSCTGAWPQTSIALTFTSEIKGSALRLRPCQVTFWHLQFFSQFCNQSFHASFLGITTGTDPRGYISKKHDAANCSTNMPQQQWCLFYGSRHMIPRKSAL